MSNMDILKILINKLTNAELFSLLGFSLVSVVALVGCIIFKVASFTTVKIFHVIDLSKDGNAKS